MLKLVRILLAAPALFVLALPAAAEKRVALVVGISAYVNARPLSNPLNDARDMTSALKAADFQVVEALDADKVQLDAALRTFTRALTDADVALFYYAGHGLQVGQQNYLVPTDAKLERERDLDFETVKLDFVLRQLEVEREGKTSIVILDACRDNPLSRNLARSMGTRSAGIGRGLAATATGLGTFIAYSTQPGNVALDGEGRNSPFASALIKEMAVKGRNLTATMIEVRKQVVEATAGAQVPWDHSALTGEFYFARGEGGGTGQDSVLAAPLTDSAEVTALKERLVRLEQEAKARDLSNADGFKLAELRARAANLEDLVKDLQKRLMDSRFEEMKASQKDRFQAMDRSMKLQMEQARRGQDLKKLKEEIAALENKAKP